MAAVTFTDQCVALGIRGDACALHDRTGQLAIVLSTDTVNGYLVRFVTDQATGWADRRELTSVPDTTVLTPRRLIEFEALHPAHTGGKEYDIRRTLGTTPARYYQLLHRAVLDGTADPHDPITARHVRARLEQTARRDA